MKYQRVAQVAEKLGVSTSTVWRWVQDGRLPKPIKLSKRVTVWRESEVTEAVERLGAA